MKENNELLLLIDGNSLINRAYFAIPPLNAPDGTPTNAVYGFCNMLIKAIADFKPTHIAVAFDLPHPTFRHIEYREYKATRKGMPDELAVQLPVLKGLLHDMGIKTASKAGYEADDIIGTLANCKQQTIIVTGDKDAFSLIDECTAVGYTKGAGNIALYDAAVFEAEYGFAPNKMVDYKALLGDASDNIPGVAGVGSKTASGLIIQFGDLDSIYKNLSDLRASVSTKLQSDKDNAYLSRRLAAIDRAVPLGFSGEDCVFSMPFPASVKERFAELRFSLAKKEELFSSQRLDDKTGGTGSKSCSLANEKIIQVTDFCQIKIEDCFAVIIGDDINIAVDSAHYQIKINHDLLGGGVDYGKVMEFLRPLLESKSIEKIVWDAKGSIKKLRSYGIELNNFFDSKLAQYLIDVTDKSAPETAPKLYSISKKQKEQLADLGLNNLYYQVELPLVYVLLDMEEAGFRLDMKLNADLGAEFEKRMRDISNDIHKEAGTDFNLNSPKQLGAVLFDKLGIPYPKKSKDYSTAAEILEPLAFRYPIVNKVLTYRKLAKLNSTYIEGFKKLADINGIVRTEFKQTLTATGRLSSVEPNLQNIPIREEEGRRLRGLFIASAECSLVVADYSQIELRLLAHFSRDEALCAAFLNNEDIHTQTAAKVFDVPLESVTPKMRAEAKAVNFGIVYGISDFGLSEQLGISVSQARDMIETYFMRFIGVKNYLDSSIAAAREKGYACTVLGRIRPIPELNAVNPNLRKFGERVAMNMPLQGSAADIIKAAMLKTVDGLKNITGAKLILQVHDELIVECPDAKIDKVKAVLKTAMEGALDGFFEGDKVLSVPLVVDVNSGKRWLDCK